ncbi:MAG: replicative DNA helicase [Thiotrichales bacterium]
MTARIPHSVEAEQAVLGAVLLKNSLLDELSAQLQSESFFLQQHQLIWGAMLELQQQKQPLDAVTISDRLRQQGRLAAAGDLTYIGGLVTQTPSAVHALAYAQRVKALLDEAQTRVLGLSLESEDDQSVRLGSALPKVLADMERRAQAGGGIQGLATGFQALDEKTLGLHPGELVIVAARPSMGKTTLGLNIAQHAAIKRRCPVQFFSLEMGAEQLIERSVSALAKVDMQTLRSGLLSESECMAVAQATEPLNPVPIYIDDQGALSLNALRSRARRQHKKHGIGLIIVDYLQLLRSPKAQNREREISEIAEGLKALAKELKVPVVALSQLNRSLEQRPNKRPIMSDLRDSGSIEQAADLILFLYRDEVYHPQSNHKGIAELELAKQRNGPTGRVYLRFDAAIQQFTSYQGTPPPLSSAAPGSNFNYLGE